MTLFVFGVPATFLSVLVYFLCCSDWLTTDDEPGDDDEDDEELEEEQLIGRGEGIGDNESNQHTEQRGRARPQYDDPKHEKKE